MVAIVTRYTTKNPQTECGIKLRELILKLKDLDKTEFTKKYESSKAEHKGFLLERNDQGQF
jgi:hypothetical protein